MKPDCSAWWFKVKAHVNPYIVMYSHFGIIYHTLSISIISAIIISIVILITFNIIIMIIIITHVINDTAIIV